jgi:hypothetical protein
MQTIFPHILKQGPLLRPHIRSMMPRINVFCTKHHINQQQYLVLSEALHQTNTGIAGKKHGDLCFDVNDVISVDLTLLTSRRRHHWERRSMMSQTIDPGTTSKWRTNGGKTFVFLPETPAKTTRPIAIKIAGHKNGRPSRAGAAARLGDVGGDACRMSAPKRIKATLYSMQPFQGG